MDWFGFVVVLFNNKMNCFISFWIVLCLYKLVLNFSNLCKLFGVLLILLFLLILNVKLNFVELMFWILRFVFKFGIWNVVFGVFWKVNIIWNNGWLFWVCIGFNILISFLNGIFWFL